MSVPNVQFQMFCNQKLISNEFSKRYEHLSAAKPREDAREFLLEILDKKVNFFFSSCVPFGSAVRCEIHQAIQHPQIWMSKPHKMVEKNKNLNQVQEVRPNAIWPKRNAATGNRPNGLPSNSSGEKVVTKCFASLRFFSFF